MTQSIDTLVVRLAQRLTSTEQRLAVAESCTGGWVSRVCTDLPGSSEWFECGYVTYSNESKVSMLGVSEQTLSDYGAVSEEVVVEMVQGALARSVAQWAVSISGVAGPGGGSPDKPVGTVCFAWAGRGSVTGSAEVHFFGDRITIRKQSVIYSLEKLLEIV